VTVEELEAVGCEVKITHFRPAPGITRRHYMTRRVLARYGARGTALEPKGGHTLAVITLPTGESFAGFAACHPKKENFSRRRGREIALGRAFADAEAEYKAGLLAV
jgi:hypothetical protein